MTSFWWVGLKNDDDHQHHNTKRCVYTTYIYMQGFNSIYSQQSVSNKNNNKNSLYSTRDSNNSFAVNSNDAAFTLSLIC